MRFVIAFSLFLGSVVSGLSCGTAVEKPTATQIAQSDGEPKGPLAKLRRFLKGEAAQQSASTGPRARQDTPFGLHAVGMPFLNKLGDSNASIVRIIITGPLWTKLETDQGLDFSKLDMIVRGLQQNGIDLVITLDANSPKWGARHLLAKKGGSAEPTTHSDTPADKRRYEKTLRAIAERYDNDGNEDMPGLVYPVDYYQIVNEWVWQWEGTEKDYLRHLKNSWRVIKDAHPGAKIILGGLTGVEYLAMEEGVDSNRMLKLGGMLGKDEPIIMSMDEFKKKRPGQVETSVAKLQFILTKGQPYFDIIDLHSYTDTYREMLPSIRVLERFAPSKTIWSMENAGPYYNYSPQRHSQELVKRYVSGLASGLRKIFWSSYNPTGGWSKNFLNLSLLSGWGRQKSAYHTYKFLASNMEGLQSVSKINAGAGVNAYRVVTSHGELFIAWADDGNRTVTLPRAARGDRFKAIALQVVRDRRIEVKNVALNRNRGRLEFQASSDPVFVSDHFVRQ
jgi:hypothetical protein